MINICGYTSSFSSKNALHQEWRFKVPCLWPAAPVHPARSLRTLIPTAFLFHWNIEPDISLAFSNYLHVFTSLFNPDWISCSINVIIPAHLLNTHTHTHTHTPSSYLLEIPNLVKFNYPHILLMPLWAEYMEKNKTTLTGFIIMTTNCSPTAFPQSTSPPILLNYVFWLILSSSNANTSSLSLLLTFLPISLRKWGKDRRWLHSLYSCSSHQCCLCPHLQPSLVTKMNTVSKLKPVSPFLPQIPIVWPVLDIAHCSLISHLPLSSLFPPHFVN